MFAASVLSIELLLVPFFTQENDSKVFFHAQYFPAQPVLPKRIAHCSQLPTTSGDEKPQLTGS